MKQKSSKRKKLLIASSIVVVSIVILFKVYGSTMRQMLEARVKREYGFRDPRVETKESLTQTALKYKLDTRSLVSIDPQSYQSLLLEFAGFPEVLIFDKQGRYIAYKSKTSDCNAGVFGFIPKLDSKGQYHIAAKTTLRKEMSRLRDMYGNPLPDNYLDANADFYILISWTAWTGKLNENHVQKWQNLAARNTKAKIQVIEVNFDAQQWWPKQSADSVLKMFKPKPSSTHHT